MNNIEKLNFIEDKINEVKSNLNKLGDYQTFGQCYEISALLIHEIESIIPEAKIIAGNVMTKNSRIFDTSLSQVIDPVSGEITTEERDPHCWIEFNNFIIDLSITETLENTPYKKTSNQLRKQSLRKEFLLLSKTSINKIKYIPASTLTYDEVSGILKGFLYKYQ